MAAPSSGRVRAVLEHNSHGRTRVRLLRAQRTPQNLERVRAHMAAQPQVTGVEVSEKSGSILIHTSDGGSVQGALAEVLELVKPLALESPSETQVAAIVDLVRQADKRLGVFTGGKASLRWMVPAAFVGVGLRQLIRQGLTIGTVPWYVLLYYGVDSFLKLYPEHAPATEQSPGGAAS